MERAGVLRATVLVDPDAVGLPLLAFTFVALSDPEAERGFLSRIGMLRQILECHHVTGEWNYLLKIRASGTRLTGWPDWNRPAAVSVNPSSG